MRHKIGGRMFHPRRLRRGFSLIELLIVIAIILIIITIAVPKYQKTQMFMRETAAIKAIQTIHQMEVQYQSSTAATRPRWRNSDRLQRRGQPLRRGPDWQ